MSPRKKPVQQGRRPSTSAGSRIYSRDNVSRYSERARQRSRGKLVRRGVLCGVLAALLLGVGVVGAQVLRIVGSFGGDGYITNSGILGILYDTDETREPFYTLLLGTDGRPGETQYRSDSIILARIDPTKKNATLISIPRDTKVEFNGSIMKINAVHSYPEDQGGGPKGMVEAVNKLCGIEISHYAEINFQGMEKLVDAVGGIEINATDSVDDPEHLDIKIEPGQQHMDGATALTYARARYQYTDGDYTRMRHQRQVLGALANKILNDMDLAQVSAMLDSLSSMLITDMSVQDILAVLNAMRGMDTNGIYSANLPSYAGADTMIDGQSYVFVYEDQLKEMMERVNAGEDPQGPQTMGMAGQGGMVGDLENNTSDDWSYGSATVEGSDSGASNDTGDSAGADSYSSDGYSDGYGDNGDYGYDDSYGYDNSGYDDGTGY